MSLLSTDLGTIASWPLRLVPQNKPTIPTTNLSILRATPTVILKATFTDVSTIDADGLVTTVAGVASASTAALSLAGALCSGGVGTFTVPRAITVTVTHGSSIVAQTFSFVGTDQYGRSISETVSITATGTSKTATTLQAFKTITSATQTAAADASANSITVGDSKVFGLPFKCASVVSVAEELNGAAATAGTLVAASAAAGADLRGTYTPNGTANGTNDWAVWFLSDDPVTVV